MKPVAWTSCRIAITEYENSVILLVLGQHDGSEMEGYWDNR